MTRLRVVAKLFWWYISPRRRSSARDRPLARLEPFLAVLAVVQIVEPFDEETSRDARERERDRDGRQLILRVGEERERKRRE
eukprot:30612-Pelagococcus_subviridis.AAC.23